MALPSSGSLSFSQIRNEFDGNNPVRLSQYYRNGGRVPDAPQNTPIPTSGAVKVSQYYGATNAIVATVTSNTNNLNVASLFGSNWTVNIPKILIINSGVQIGSTSQGADALVIPNTLVGQLTIENNGSIRGAGGNGGVGGNAVRTSSPITITNNGQIYSGGGAGGRGGTGGAGTVGCQVPSTCCSTNPGFCAPRCNGPNTCNLGLCNERGQTSCCCGPNCFNVCCAPLTSCSPCTKPGSCPASGGAGGAGGTGQGYTVPGPATNGSPGSGASGNAGAGGTGGRGGDFGNAGSPGSPGFNGGSGGGSTGQPGFAAGFYIVGNNRVTWDRLGTVRGRVAA